jgi:hypothetical protein
LDLDFCDRLSSINKSRQQLFSHYWLRHRHRYLLSIIFSPPNGSLRGRETMTKIL